MISAVASAIIILSGVVLITMGVGSKISIVYVNHPEDVPPTETLVGDQLETAPLVSCPETSSVASTTVLRFTIAEGAEGGTSNVVLVALCPAKPTTHEVLYKS
jgi:hypothetical protein